MRLWDGRVRWEAFGGHGVSWPEWGVGSRLPLVTNQGGTVGIELDPLAGAYFVEIAWVKARNMALEERHTLEELTFNALGVATRRKGLAVTVLLLACSAGGRTSGASRVL